MRIDAGNCRNPYETLRMIFVFFAVVSRRFPRLSRAIIQTGSGRERNDPGTKEADKYVRSAKLLQAL